MAYKTPALWLATPLILFLSACNPASPPSDPAPAPVVPPTTATAAPVPQPAPIQPAKADLSPVDQPSQVPVSCREERGDLAAKRLVDRCLAVSPATRPPCHAANPCTMIEDEIKRSCDMYGPTETRPAECSA